MGKKVLIVNYYKTNFQLIEGGLRGVGAIIIEHPHKYVVCSDISGAKNIAKSFLNENIDGEFLFIFVSKYYVNDIMESLSSCHKDNIYIVDEFYAFSRGEHRHSIIDYCNSDGHVISLRCNRDNPIVKDIINIISDIGCDISREKRSGFMKQSLKYSVFQYKEEEN